MIGNERKSVLTVVVSGARLVDPLVIMLLRVLSKAAAADPS